MFIHSWALIALGGALGALCRYGIGRSLAHCLGAGFPYGTLCVNLIGSLAFGGIMGWGLVSNTNSPSSLLLFGATGFLGAFTTFSTFSYEALLLIQREQWGLCVGFVLSNVLGGLLLCALGLYFTKGAL